VGSYSRKPEGIALANSSVSMGQFRYVPHCRLTDLFLTGITKAWGQAKVLYRIIFGSIAKREHMNAFHALRRGNENKIKSLIQVSYLVELQHMYLPVQGLG
jgi:hypothetical protein